MTRVIIVGAVCLAVGWAARARRARRRARQWPQRAVTEIAPRLTHGEHAGLVTVSTRTPDGRLWSWSMGEDSALPVVREAGRIPDDARELEAP